MVIGNIWFAPFWDEKLGAGGRTDKNYIIFSFFTQISVDEISHIGEGSEVF